MVTGFLGKGPCSAKLTPSNPVSCPRIFMETLLETVGS